MKIESNQKTELKYYTIKTEKQPNGLFGTPQHCQSITYNTTTTNEVIISAIVMMYHEIFPHADFHLTFWQDTTLVISNKLTYDSYYLDDYILDGNVLYILKTIQEKRKYKIEKILKRNKKSC